MNPKLIYANLALMHGDRIETGRRVAEYQQTMPADDPDMPLVLWLEAQAQPDPDERLKRLRALVSSVPANNRYHELASLTLAQEAEYETKLNPPNERPERTIIGVALWKVGLFALVGGLAALLLFSLFVPLTPAPPSEDTSTLEATSNAAVLPTRTALPDQSLPLLLDSHTMRYDAGILQVGAVEDTSARVLDAQSQTPLTPIAGARFYALKIVFECRAGICDQPPQATLGLRIDDRFVIEPRAGVVIDGAPSLEPVALGRATTGWVVFEIPAAGVVTGLQITPLNTGGAGAPTPAPLLLPLQTP